MAGFTYRLEQEDGTPADRRRSVPLNLTGKPATLSLWAPGKSLRVVELCRDGDESVLVVEAAPRSA
jgi:hypothetical protein